MAIQAKKISFRFVQLISLSHMSFQKHLILIIVVPYVDTHTLYREGIEKGFVMTTSFIYKSALANINPSFLYTNDRAADRTFL